MFKKDLVIKKSDWPKLYFVALKKKLYIFFKALYIGIDIGPFAHTHKYMKLWCKNIAYKLSFNSHTSMAHTKQSGGFDHKNT